MEDMTLNNSAANAEVNMNESTSVNENVSVGTDTPTVLPESPVIGFQAVDAEGNVLGFVSKAELVNEAKQALYADLAILDANRPTTLPANSMLAETSTLAATDVYEDQLAIKSDAPYIRGLDASGNPIRISKADLASVVGGLIGAVNSNKNGLATPSMYNSKPFTAYSAIRCYKLGKNPRCLLFGGRDGARGAYFVATGDTILKILDHDSKIKFYRDDDNNIYADTVTGFNIAALSFLGEQRITGVPSFDPQNYTEITPI